MTNMVNWSKRLNMGLMRKRRNYLELGDRPKRPPNNAATATHGEFKQELSECGRSKKKQSDGAAMCQFYCWGRTHSLTEGSHVFLPKM